MQTSEQINEIAAALAKAQGAMEHATKDSTNPHFRSKYADLASITDACREALTANSVAVIQAPGTTDDGAVTMTTRLAHASGQWIETVMACRPAKPDAQSMGSVISYLRRYCLAAMAGVVADDDDGESAVGRGELHATAPYPAPQPRQPPKAPQRAVPAAIGGALADRAPARPDEPFDDPMPPALRDKAVEYVNAAGVIEEVPLDVGIRKLRAAHRAVDKLDNAGWFELYKANAEWLERDAPKVAAELSVRGG